MGQKIHPFGFRLGSLYSWKSRWFADKKQYKTILLEDKKLRDFLSEKLKNAGLVKVEIERSIKIVKIKIFVSRPGVVIGRGGSSLEQLNKDIHKLLKIKENDSKAVKVDIRVEEVKKPDMQAKLVAERIKNQLQGRYPHRRAVNQALDKIMEAGAKGAKIQLSGRIAGAEIGRTEKYARKNVPTQTLRSDIDYAQMPALTKSGYVGIKVWIYKGEKTIE